MTQIISPVKFKQNKSSLCRTWLGSALRELDAATESESQPCLYDQLLANVWDQRLSQSNPLRIAGLWKRAEKCSLAGKALIYKL